VARPPAHDLDEGPQPAIARASRLRLSAPAIVLFLSFVDVFALLPTVAPYVASLGGGPAFVGLAVGAYSAANLPANVVGGILVDRLGRRRVTMLGLALAALAVAVYPLAATPTAVVVARLLHGAAGGILVPAVFAAAGDRTGARGAGRTMGRMGALIGAAAVVAPAAAGILRQAAGTTAVFLTVSALLGVGFVIAWRFIEDAVVVQPRPKGSGGRVVRDLLREPTLQRAYAATACLTVSVGVLAGFLPGTAETLGARPSVVGLLFTAYALVAGALMLSPLSGRVDREGADRLAGIGLVLLAVALAALVVTPSVAWAALACAVFGAGYGLVFPAVTGATSLAATDATRGRAFGLFNAAFSVGIAVGPPVVGAVAQRVPDLDPFVPSAAVTLGAGVWILASASRRARAGPVVAAVTEVSGPVASDASGA
jgi:MFS transporter, DHA1 family, multidrug resistance protein